MPYRVPNTFFDDVENEFIVKIQIRHKSHNLLKIMYRSIAVAATLALLLLFVVVGNPVSFNHKTDFAEIAQAFDNLSDADQSYLLEIYQYDVFINE